MGDFLFSVSSFRRIISAFLLLFRRMSSGIFVVHCAACYAASSVAIPPHVMRHVLCPLYGILSPYARFPPTPVGLTLGATPPSSFLPFPSFDISICRISLSRNLRCPARPALSCAREFRERSSLLLLWARGIGGLAARTLVPLGFFFPRPVRRILAAPARYASNAGVSLCRI